MRNPLLILQRKNRAVKSMVKDRANNNGQIGLGTLKDEMRELQKRELAEWKERSRVLNILQPDD